MKYTKTAVDTNLRDTVFDDLLGAKDGWDNSQYVKINDRQYGIILTDLNGVERYVRIGAIVAEERDDMTARELMQSEIDKYNEAQQKKAEQKRKAEAKAAADKAKREAKAKEKEAQGE